MSHEATLWAWRQSDINSPMRMLVLLHMADSCSAGNDNQSWFSLEGIARRCRMSRRSARTHVAGLIESGHLTLVHKGGPKAGTNRYRVNVGEVLVQTGPAGSDAPMEPSCSAGAALGSAGAALGSAGAAPDPSAGAAPKPVITEPVKETEREPSDAAAPDDLSVRRRKERPAPTREQEIAIVHAYLSALPSWPTVTSKRWGTSKARDGLRARWAGCPDAREPDFWPRFFAAVRRKSFWMTGGEAGGPIEQARLSWLLTPSKFEAVREIMDELEEAAA